MKVGRPRKELRFEKQVEYIDDQLEYTIEIAFMILLFCIAYTLGSLAEVLFSISFIVIGLIVVIFSWHSSRKVYWRQVK